MVPEKKKRKGDREKERESERMREKETEREGGKSERRGETRLIHVRRRASPLSAALLNTPLGSPS